MKTSLLSLSIFVSACAHSPNPPPPSPGFYVEAGIGVHPVAVQRADQIASQMLADAPEVRELMRVEPYTLIIMSRFYRLTDMPGYESLRGYKLEDGRTMDELRGGASRTHAFIPEENLLCAPEQPYFDTNVTVHELTHSIEDYIDFPVFLELKEAYANALERGLYSKDQYLMRNHHEYFAVAGEAWFNSTSRVEGNGGINTREKLAKHDPKIAAVMEKVFGEAELERPAGCAY